MDSAQRALDALDEAISRDGDQPQEVDALLLETLAAVVQEAMDWRKAADAWDADFTTKNADKLNASEDAMRAALDAFAVAAQEMFP